ncbi:MAG: response regulator [Gammaproteobacteria bacterium]|nr:response regulator [Gammaproteobacteria bacterium]
MNQKTYTVLLVEDNDDDAFLTESVVKNFQSEITVVVNRVIDGKEALDYMLNQDKYSDSKYAVPDLVLLDLKMPRLNGLSFLQHISEQTDLTNVPVVVLTTSLEQSDIAQAYKYGANAYMRKPVDFGEFVAQMDIVLNFWLLINKRPQY